MNLDSFQDAHGYELEIAEMKEKVNKYNQVVQVGLAIAFKKVRYKKQNNVKMWKVNVNVKIYVLNTMYCIKNTYIKVVT